MDIMRQVIAKLSRFIIHQTLKELISATLDDNSSCSTDVVVELKELIIATTDHDSHVISIQTLYDNSSCSTDGVAELKELLFGTTYHDSHAISKKVGIPSILPFPPTAGDGIRHYCSSLVKLEELEELAVAAIVEKIGIPPFLPIPPTAGDGIMHYCSNHSILLVGEGDFSFSACLAKAFGSADNMVATSLNSLGFLEKNYPSAKTNIGYLRNRGGIVLHKVDATNMEFNILVNGYIYDRIIFNFPLAGFFNESRRQDLKRNRKLVRSFMENAKNLMASDGEIHITHKTSPMYQEWGMENLAKQCGLKLIEEVEFELSDYPGYHNKYGFGGNDDFNCYPSNTYKFGLK